MSSKYGDHRKFRGCTQSRIHASCQQIQLPAQLGVCRGSALIAKRCGTSSHQNICHHVILDEWPVITQWWFCEEVALNHLILGRLQDCSCCHILLRKRRADEMCHVCLKSIETSHVKLFWFLVQLSWRHKNIFIVIGLFDQIVLGAKEALNSGTNSGTKSYCDTMFELPHLKNGGEEH